MSMQAELVIDAKGILCEGPCWDEQTEQLYWLDIIGKKLHIYDSKTNEKSFFQFDQYVGSFAFRKGGGIILAAQNGFYFAEIEDGKVIMTEICDPESHLPNNRFNDGKCDPTGRFWAGTMSMKREEGKGALYSLDINKGVAKKINGVSISNGLTWSLNQKTFYYIDTPTRQIFAYEFNKQKGTIDNRRVVKEFNEKDGFPDGMTIDMEGMLWVCLWDGYAVVRINPETGVVKDRIFVPAAQVSSCVFGGKDLDELYITTARIGLNEAELAEHPHSGGVFRCKMAVRGLPFFRFAG